MTGAIIQLVAYGYENLFLSLNPQITFFKVVYRRHTNFTYEQIQQNFTDPPDFGKSVTSTIAKNGDLMGNIIAVITLPAIKQIDNFTKIAWVRKIGFAIIKYVNIQLNGVEIDRHYAEWLNLWCELSGYIRGGEKSDGFNKMIGNIPELYNFTFSKDSYKLHVPLQFWFCKNSGSYLPLSALEYTDVKINIQFNDIENCYLISPSNYIESHNNIVNYIPGEYIQQGSGSSMAAGIFDRYDLVTNRIYYYRITNNNFISIESTLSDPAISLSDSDNTKILLSNKSSNPYLIIGHTSKYESFPRLNSVEKSYGISTIRNLKLLESFLLVDYYYLDEDERNRFMNAKHDYLIEQLFFTPNNKITGTNSLVKINALQPCKLILWVNQFDYIYKSGDYFNYTDSYIRKKFSSEHMDIKLDDPIGKNIAISEYFLLNGKECVSSRSSDYFEKIETLQYLDYQLAKGSNMLSFSLYPHLSQPSGSCNLSQIELPQIGLKLSPLVDNNNFVNCRSYCLCHNLLRIVYGFAAPVFIH